MSSLEAEQSIMKITAVPVLRPEFRAASGLMARLSDFAALMKPRVTLLAVFTAGVGLLIAPTHLDRSLQRLQSLRSRSELAQPALSICGTTPTSIAS